MLNDVDIKAIVSECRAGSLSRFTRIYEAYVPKIYAFVFYRTHHKETAEDLTSQIFLKALRSIRSFDPDKGTLLAWLYRIARNTVIDHVRTRKPEYELGENMRVSAADQLDDAVDARQRLKKVQAYLETLPAEQRELVIMRVWDELSYQEIAEIMGKSEAACRMMFSRTLAELKRHFPLTVLFALFVDYLYG